MELIVTRDSRDFFVAVLHPWLLCNLGSNTVTKEGCHWSVVLRVTMWSLWRSRNSRIFRQQFQSKSSIVQTIKNTAADIEHAMDDGSRASVNRHKAGEVGRLEIPFDRALNKGDSGLAGAGGLIKGFVINTSFCSSVRTELWGAITGLGTRLGCRILSTYIGV